MGHAALTAGGPTRLARISGWLLLLVWLAELGALLTHAALLSTVATFGLIAFVVLAWLRASRHIRVLFVLVAGGAAGIALFLGDPRVLVRGFERAQIFGAFLPSVLLLRATVETSPRVARLRVGVGRLTDEQARSFTLYGSHALGAVLNVGAMAILAPVLERHAGDARRVELAASAARGVGTAIAWSPFFVAMAFTSQLVPAAALWQTMLIGAVSALLGLALAQFMFTPKMNARDFVESVRQFGPLVVPTLVMVGCVVACTVLLGYSGLQAVALVLPILCVAYLVTRGPAVASGAARRALASFGRLADELLIVVGALVLGVAVGSLPQVAQWATGMSPGVIAGAPLLVVLVVIFVGLGQFGLHPMIGASLFVPVIAAGPFGISPPVLVAAVVFAWGLSATISIWTLPVAVAATTFGVPVAALYTRRALAFAAVWCAAALVYMAAVNAWLVGRAAAG
ncbi:MAG TPA: hypothetical protein VFN64_01540 [Burkholderiaceae bacterium]|nr:hypothetical protein [Burkholderiaceae bacterium]